MRVQLNERAISSLRALAERLALLTFDPLSHLRLGLGCWTTAQITGWPALHRLYWTTSSSSLVSTHRHGLSWLAATALNEAEQQRSKAISYSV